MSSQEQSNIRVVGPYRDVPHLAADLQSHLQNARDKLVVPGEAQTTDAELAMIAQVNNSLVVAGEEIGLDLRDRLLPPNNYHFFDSRKDFDDAARAIGHGDIPGGGGVYNPNNGLWWVRRSDEFENVTGMAHEGTHSVTLHKARMVITHQEIIDGDTHNTLGGRVWYGSEFRDNGLLETTTDMFARRAMLHGGWKRMLYSYFGIDTISSELVCRAAKQHDMNPKDVESLLIEGMLKGHGKGLRLLAGAIGRQGMRDLVNFSGREKDERYLDFARQHGLDRSAEILEAAIAGVKDIEFPFGWEKHSSSSRTARPQEAPAAPEQEVAGLLGNLTMTVSRLALIEVPDLADRASEIQQAVESVLTRLEALGGSQPGSPQALSPQIEILSQAVRRMVESQELLTGRDVGAADRLQRYLGAISAVNFDWPH